MKRLMLIGGIISMVLPAMADGLDLSGYHLITDNPSSCESPAGLDLGFEDGSVQMTPLFVNKCDPGYWLDADNASVLAPGETGNDTEYYVVNACATCAPGKYCEGVQSPNVDSNNVLQSVTAAECPASYQYSDVDTDDEDSTKWVLPKRINDCYKTCLNADITDAIRVQVHAKPADGETAYISYSKAKAYYNTDCLLAIEQCANGYNKIDLKNGTYQYCDIDGVRTEDCTALGEKGNWKITSSGPAEQQQVFTGTFACNDSNACIVTVSGLNISFTLENYDDAASCSAGCGQDNDHIIPMKITTNLNNNIPTDGVYCLGRTVEVSWKDGTPAANTCVYGGTLDIATPANLENYVFKGWAVSKATTTEP